MQTCTYFVKMFNKLHVQLYGLMRISIVIAAQWTDAKVNMMPVNTCSTEEVELQFYAFA